MVMIAPSFFCPVAWRPCASRPRRDSLTAEGTCTLLGRARLPQPDLATLGRGPFPSQINNQFLLCVCYLENHVFLGTRIDRKISARHVLLKKKYRRCTTASLFQLYNTEQFLHRYSWSRVIGTKTFNPHSTLIMMPPNTGIGCPSCTHPRALVGTIQASSSSGSKQSNPL